MVCIQHSCWPWWISESILHVFAVHNAMCWSYIQRKNLYVSPSHTTWVVKLPMGHSKVCGMPCLHVAEFAQGHASWVQTLIYLKCPGIHMKFPMKYLLKVPRHPLRNLMHAEWGMCDTQAGLMHEHQNKHTHTHNTLTHTLSLYVHSVLSSRSLGIFSKYSDVLS